MYVLPGASGQPEVREHRAPVAVDEHVVGFEVAMDDARVVSVLEALAHLAQVAPGGGAVERAAVEDVAQCAAANQRHGEEHDARCDHEVDDRQDVGVVKARERARLLLEALDEAFIRDEVGHQRLERDLATERLLDCAIHNRHPAGAEALFDVVVPERRPGEFLHLAAHKGSRIGKLVQPSNVVPAREATAGFDREAARVSARRASFRSRARQKSRHLQA
jgi:hypothetical protein